MVKKFFVFLIIFLLMPNVSALLVVTNSIDLRNAEEVINFWKDNGLEVNIISADEYKSVREAEELTVILGGPDAPEGIGSVVRNILTIEEQEKIRKDKGVFVKDYKGSKIIIFAGADRNKTKEVLFLKKDIVFDHINMKKENKSKEIYNHYDTTSRDAKELNNKSKIVLKKENNSRMILYAKNFKNVGALQLRIEYDPKELTVVNVEKGILLKNALMMYKIDNKNGTIRVAFVALNGISGNGELLVLNTISHKSYFEVKIYIEDITDIYNNPIDQITVEEETVMGG